jgi:primase-polymerase (primpol)-like protein
MSGDIIEEIFGGLGCRFAVWAYETRDGKPAKVPYQARGVGRARSDDPRTWATLAEARGALDSGRYAGLAVFLGDLGDGRYLVGLDLDLCRNPNTGEIADWAEAELDRWAGCYAEVSPSGTGVKAFGVFQGKPPITGKEVGVDAPIPNGAEKAGHSKPEIGLYAERRFFAITGQRLR